MAKDSSFEIVSEIDFQEADNDVNQAIKEIHQRYDLKDSATELELNKKDKLINLNTKDDYSRKQSIEILQTKFIKRGLSIKVMKLEEPEPSQWKTKTENFFAERNIERQRKENYKDD